MAEHAIDLDLLAKHLQSKIDEEALPLRDAATDIGVSPATLSRLLKGSDTPNYPDSTTLLKAASWVGKSIGEFQRGRRKKTTSLADVEVHLRALPGIKGEDKEALVAMVRAAYDAAHRLRKKEE